MCIIRPKRSHTSQRGELKMKILGLVFNNNMLAVMLGISMILLGIVSAYLFQKKYFGKYRGKIPNSRVKDD